LGDSWRWSASSHSASCRRRFSPGPSRSPSANLSRRHEPWAEANRWSQQQPPSMSSTSFSELLRRPVRN
jgi:hypothetical protein